jgi:ABC-type bacteriocin/lantibiotic exporter with double-glycine peptidase domain
MNALSFPGAQPGDVKTALRRLAGLLATERPDLRTILIYAIGAGLFTLTIPIAVQTLVNTVAFGTLLQPLVVMTVLVIGGLGLYGLLTALEVYVVELLQRRIFLRVVGDLSYRIPRARMAALDKTYGPEHLNRFFDVFTIHKATAQLLVDGLDLVLKTAIGLLLLAFYHPILLAFDVLLVLALYIVVFVLGRNGMKTSIVESKKKYRLAGWLEELGRRPAMFKGPGAMKLARDRADAYTRDFIVARIAHFKVVMRQTIGSLVVYAVASGALLGIGGWLVMDGQLTIGQLVAAELVLTAVVTAFAKIGKHLESFYDLVAGVDKVGALFDIPVEATGGDGAPLAASPSGSSFEARSISLDLAGRPVLRNLELTLESGDRAALLGGSGSGKSVFTEVAFGLRSPKKGQIRIDGAHIEDIPLGTMRTRVAVARGDDVVQGSLLDNVRVGDPDVTKDAARSALSEVELDHAVERFPDGLDTEIFPGGRPLTEAETARLVMARAIAARPSLLIVDGLLDLQDEEVRARLLERLSDPAKPWTLLVLTRVESVARALPRAFRLDGGATADLPAEEPSRC